jgi:cytochrome P450
VDSTTRPTFRPPLPWELMTPASPFGAPAALMALADQGPVHRVAMRTGDPFWLVSGHAQARAVLADPRFSADRFRNDSMLRHMSASDRERARSSRAGFFGALDPPEHTRYRRLLTSQFTVRRMRAINPHIERIITEHLDALLADGTTADLVPQFAVPFPSQVICELMGVSADHRAELSHRTGRLFRMDIPVEETLAAKEQLRDVIRAVIERKRRSPGDDVISGLMHRSDADPPLTDDELVNITYILTVAGHETMASMLALGTFAMLEHPAQLAALRADPTLINGAVNELLRYLTVIRMGVMRHASEDIQLAGHLIPAGALVIVSLLAANRDGNLWPRPDELDVTRPHNPHLAFGYGIHQCLGQQLARAELADAFRHLLRRLPNLRLAIPADKVPLRADMSTYGVHSLPVTWDPVLD